MKATISEVAMLTIAFNGKVNEMKCGIEFNCNDLPEWVHHMFDSSIIFDANGFGTIKLDKLIIDAGIGFLGEFLLQPILLTRLYNSRWITPVNFAKELSDEEFSDFIQRFEKNVLEYKIDKSKMFNAVDDLALFMALNFIVVWSDGNCYETNDGKTVFRCNKSILSKNIDVRDLCITDKVYCMEMPCADLPIIDVVYFEIESLEVREMLHLWYRVSIKPGNPCDEKIKKVVSGSNIEIDENLCYMMINALHQYELKAKTEFHEFENTEDVVIASLILASRKNGLPLFAEPAFKGKNLVFTPIYDFKRIHENSYYTFMDELSRLTRKSNNWYIDVSENLVMLDHTGHMSPGYFYKVDPVKEYIDGNGGSQLFPALNHAIKLIEKKRLLDTMEDKNVTMYQYSNMVLTDNTGHIFLEDILIDFALYYIRKTNIMSDSAIENYLINLIPKERKLSERKLVNSYTVKLFLIHFSKILPDGSGFEKVIVDPDKPMDDFIWDLGIHGMIDCVMLIATNYPDAYPEIANQVRCLLSLLKPLDEGILYHNTSNLMKVAMGDINFTQNAGENLLILCAALNRETYGSLAYTNYIIENLLYIGNSMQRGVETCLLRSIEAMEQILHITDVDEFKSTISLWLTTNQIPTPIRKLGSVVLKSILATHSKFALTNRADFLDVLNNIDASADQPSNVHIFNEFTVNTPQVTDMLCLKKLLLYGYKLGFAKTTMIDSRITSVAELVTADKVQIIMSNLNRV